MKTAIPSLSRIALLLSLLVIIVLFYLINVNTPLRMDDYWVIRVIEKHPDGTYSFTEKMISSLQELVQSWYYHRSYWVHGRISDYVGAAILVTGGKAAFNVLNTLVFIAYLWVFCKLCFHRFTLSGAAILLLTSIVVNPCIAGTIFWVCGAMNYLWPSIPLAIVLMGVRKLEKDKTLTKTKLMFVCFCAFLCGAFHEGLGCTLGGAMVLYWVIQRSKGNRLPVAYLWIMITVGLGTLIPLTAPAMWNRAAGIPVELNDASATSPTLTLDRLGEAVVKTMKGAFSSLLSLPLHKNTRIPLFLLGVCLIWKRGRYVSSLVGCFALMNLVMVVILSNNGHGRWGGLYYFLGLSAGISILSCLPKQKLSAKWGLWIATLTLFPIVFSTSHSFKIKKVYDTAVSSLSQVDGFHPVDMTPLGGDYPFSLEGALPVAGSIPTFVHTFAQYHGQRPCRFVLQYSKPIPRVEKAFSALREDEVHLRKCSGSLVLRLPRDCAMATSITVKHTTMPPLRILVMPEKWKPSSRLTSLFRNEKLEYCGKFFVGDICYIVLPDEVAAYTSIELTLRDQDGKCINSIIDLNSVK